VFNFRSDPDYYHPWMVDFDDFRRDFYKVRSTDLVKFTCNPTVHKFISVLIV